MTGSRPNRFSSALLLLALFLGHGCKETPPPPLPGPPAAFNALAAKAATTPGAYLLLFNLPPDVSLDRLIVAMAGVEIPGRALLPAERNEFFTGLAVMVNADLATGTIIVDNAQELLFEARRVLSDATHRPLACRVSLVAEEKKKFSLKTDYIEAGVASTSGTLSVPAREPAGEAAVQPESARAERAKP